ncbi:hypothetical protein BKA65DRAFT_483456 [Rhexocercosporidium sp. MPI-PUGE-AT-0058]|nr:hypothetical protein BKA65DRAFT_483456 [Rhexocercosporidium sp. MPI-PUGE-AT-0058]
MSNQILNTDADTDADIDLPINTDTNTTSSDALVPAAFADVNIVSLSSSKPPPAPVLEPFLISQQGTSPRLLDVDTGDVVTISSASPPFASESTPTSASVTSNPSHVPPLEPVPSLRQDPPLLHVGSITPPTFSSAVESASKSCSTFPISSSSSSLLRQQAHPDPQIRSLPCAVGSQESIVHTTHEEVQEQESSRELLTRTSKPKSRRQDVQSPQKLEETGTAQNTLIGVSKRKREEDHPRHLKSKHIGREIERGGFGIVLAYNRGSPETLVVKLYLNATRFENELYAYQTILASDASIPVPHFHEQVVFPGTSSTWRMAMLRQKYKHPSGLVLERMKGPEFDEALHLLESSQRTALRMETRTCLADLHRLGICHGDIKGNNIMFRTSEQKDWVFIDFGEAFFYSLLSAKARKAWKRACAFDQTCLSEIFDVAEARYAIDVGTKFLESYTAAPSDIVQADHDESLVSADTSSLILEVDYLRNHPNPRTLSCDKVQQYLCSVLEFATRLPDHALKLVRAILDTFHSPIPSLALHAIVILRKQNRIDEALEQLDIQLANPHELLPLMSRGEFNCIKLDILLNYGSHEVCIATLEKALPVLVECYGDEDWRTKKSKRELQKRLPLHEKLKEPRGGADSGCMLE